MTPEIAPGTPLGETPTVAPSEAKSSNGQDLTLKVLAAVGTGIGVLGFVAFFGGAILWLRAEQAELPANDAVSAIPNGVLVTTGASFLVPAVLIALLAVSVIFIVHLVFDVPRRILKRGLQREARLIRLEAETEGREAEAQTQHAQAARALATRLAETAEQARLSPSPAVDLKGLIGQAEAQEREAKREEAAALAMTSRAAEKKAEADNIQATYDFELERSERQYFAEIVVGVVMLIVVPPVLNEAILHVSFIWSGLILVAVAVMAGAVSVMTYVVTERSVWFGVVAFITVGIYIGFATYFSTTGNPKVEPAAALRGDRPPLVGVFIADTSSNLYLGTFPDGEKLPRLLVVPRSQVTDLAIGPLLDPGIARRRAIALALDECRQKIDQKPKAGQATSPKPKPACSKDQRETLPSSVG